jgi:maltooligosyltrehalose trehalohydrolase
VNSVATTVETDRTASAFGVRHLAERQVQLQLWAPSATTVDVVMGDAACPMSSDGAGWFRETIDVVPGTRYHFLIDGKLCAPDPASRAQDGDVDGDSIVADPHSYDWLCQGWKGRPWHEAVICEVHAGLLGGFNGLRAQLPELADSGYTAIELMPIAEFPGARNWGYDGVLPYAVEASYGTPDELKALIDDAHALGLMVLLDVVYNHFGPDGNFLPVYAAEFFRKDDPTPWGDAIDFNQRQVQNFYIDNALMWLNEYRFDGLRFDAAHAIAPESFLGELSKAIREGTDADRHIHLILENEHNAVRLLREEFDAQWNDDGHNALHVLLTGETESYYADFATDPTAQLARVLSEGFAFQGQPDRRGVPRGEPSAALSPSSFVFFLQNHDQVGNRPLGDRLIQTVPLAQFRAATALIALCPMIPLFFMGDEYGCRTPFLFFTSHRPELAEKIREGRRGEFSQFAGFADPEQRAAIPDPNDVGTFDMSRPTFENPTVAETWRKWFAGLLEVRREYMTPRLADAKALKCEVLGPGALLARWQLGDGSEWRIAINLGTARVELPLTSDEELIYSLAPKTTAEGSHATLAPGDLLAWCAPGSF